MVSPAATGRSTSSSSSSSFSVQIPRIIFRYLVVALALNVYMAPGATVADKLENAFANMFGSMVRPLSSWTRAKEFYTVLETTGAVAVLKVALLCKAIAYTLRRKNSRATEAQAQEGKKKE